MGLIFQDGGRLGFLKSSTFQLLVLLEGPICVIVPNVVPIGKTFAEIWSFLDFSRWRPPPSWIFKLLTVGTVKRVELCPPSWICDACVRTAYNGLLQKPFVGGLYHRAKFGLNRCSSFHNMHVFQFCEFGLKTPTDVPKIGVLEILGGF